MSKVPIGCCAPTISLTANNNATGSASERGYPRFHLHEWTPLSLIGTWGLGGRSIFRGTEGGAFSDSAHFLTFCFVSIFPFSSFLFHFTLFSFCFDRPWTTIRQHHQPIHQTTNIPITIPWRRARNVNGLHKHAHRAARKRQVRVVNHI